MVGRNFSNVSPQTTLVGAVNDSITTITVADDPVISADFTAVITPSATKSGEEVVLVTAVTPNGGNYDLTVTRGFDETSAKAHLSGATFIHVVIADDMANMHIDGGSY